MCESIKCESIKRGVSAMKEPTWKMCLVFRLAPKPYQYFQKSPVNKSDRLQKLFSSEVIRQFCSGGIFRSLDSVIAGFEYWSIW